MARSLQAALEWGGCVSAALIVPNIQTAPIAGATIEATKVRPTDRDELFVKSIAKAWDGAGSHTLTCMVVEDDVTMRQLITNYLEENGIRTISASGRVQVLGNLRHRPDLVVLDLRLGHEDGLDLLREIRAQSDVPVIIVTGHRRDEMDRVVGLELGADDYLTKPFGLRELLARIRAVLRRRDAAPAQRDEKGLCALALGSLIGELVV